MTAEKFEKINFIPEISKYIINNISDSATLISPGQIGVYKNDKKLSTTPTLDDLGISDITSGIGLVVKDDWHEVFYETPDSYVYHIW